MSLPLAFLQDGRDRLLDAKIQPMVMVFDSQLRHRQKRRPKSKKPNTSKTTVSPPTFAFINISKPAEEDEDSRRLIRTHVMQNVLRRAEKQKAQIKRDMVSELSMPENESLKYICFRQTTQSMENSPQAPLSNLIVFPIQMQPYMRRLIHNYAVLMLPADAKVTDSAWFPLIMTDAALFHALLCTSALFVNAISEVGSKDSLIHRKHMFESVRLINARLSGDKAITDATITTILFMAKAEASLRFEMSLITELNLHVVVFSRKSQDLGCPYGWCKENSRTQRWHKDAVKSDTTKDLYNFSIDLLGCIENGSMPRFPFINLPNPISLLYVTGLPPNVTALAEIHLINQGLLNVLGEISAYIASQAAIEETPSLHYRLLSFYSETRHGIDSSLLRGRFHCHSLETQRHIIEESLLVGALLYLSLPHLSTVLPSIRPVNYGYLLSCLTTCIDLLFDYDTIPQHSVLLLWLSFLGVIFSSPCAARSRFRLQFRAVMTGMGIITWEGMSLYLSALWWIEPIYDDPYRHLWEEIYLNPNN